MPVLVGYAPTAEGRAALKQAVLESRMRGTALIAVTSARAEAGAPTGDDVAAALAALGAVGEGVTPEVRTPAKADAADDLLSVAGEVGAEVIVIGLRRRTPVGKLILGSNAQRILLDAPCPVLAVTAGPE